MFMSEALKGERKSTSVKKSRSLICTVVSRQSSPHFACAPSHDARDYSLLCSPRFTLTLLIFISFLIRTLSPHFCLLVLPGIYGRAAIEIVNSWQDKFKEAKTDFEEAVISIWY